MRAEQTNVDTIANNLSNVNTTGFKGQRTEFKSLLYQTIQTRSTSGNGDAKPVGAQVGLGTRVAATTSTYTQGPLNSTERPTDFALEGDGFFAVRGTDNQTYYTRNGAFTWSQYGNGHFAALDALAEAWGCEINKSKWQGLYGIAQVDGRKVMLLKPLTYMNLSGQSIAPAAAFYKIPRNHIIVLCDDIAQEPGHIRIRPSGSAGGHNGLKSIIASTGGEDFYRIRIGVGAKPRPDYDLADWVLGKFPPDDAKLVTGRHTDVEAACRLLMAGKLGEAQNKFNH